MYKMCNHRSIIVTRVDISVVLYYNSLLKFQTHVIMISNNGHGVRDACIM